VKAGASALLLVMAACLMGPAWANEGAADESMAGQERVARLKAAVEAQQQRVDALEAELTAARGAEQEGLRADAMRQQIREVLSEQEFRESLMPSMLQAGYDKGFFIRSSDDNFFMKITGRIQFRWTHYGTSSRNLYARPRLERDDRTGFDLQRIRLGLSGHLYSKDLTYLLEFRSDSGEGYDTQVRYAWVNYRWADELQVRLGIFKLAGTRQQMMSSGSFQFVDRCMTDAVFSLGTGLGVRFWGQLLDKRVDWYIDVVNSFNDFRGRTIVPDGARELDNNPALVGHIIWHALGDQPGDLMKSESDVAFHESPALDLGVHYAFNEDEGDATTLNIPFRRASLLPGAYGVTTSNGMQINQLGADIAFQWQGFSATLEYMARFLDPRRANRAPFTPYTLLTGDGDDSCYHGGYLQMGYFLPLPGTLEKKIELVGRVGGVADIGPGSEGSWEYAGGLNYFIKGHNVKLQTDVTKIYEAPVRTSSGSIANVNDDALVWRVQLQVQL